MKFTFNKPVAAVVACGLAMISLGAVAGTASADPVGTPTQRTLAGVGSDTTYNVLNGLLTVRSSKNVIASRRSQRSKCFGTNL